MVMSGSQRYPFNFYLINDVEDIVEFLVWKVLDSHNLNFC